MTIFKWPLSINLLVFFLVFATFCGPKSPKTPERKIEGVEFSHLDLSTHKLNETKLIDITSSIILNFQSSGKIKNYSLVESSCFNTYLKTFSGFSRIENSLKLPVKDILPPEAFTPTSNPQLELYCDFKIEVYNEKRKLALILLNEIRITNIENYSNLPLPLKGLVKDKSLYIQKKDMEDLELIVPLEKGEIFTLCEESGKVHPFNGQILPMSDFFSDELFNEKNLSLCRLVAYQKNPSKIWISDSFFVQGKVPEVVYEYQDHYKVRNFEVHWGQEELGVLNLFNQGSSVVYFQIPDLSTKVSVAGVYSYHSSDINYKSQTLELNAWWTVKKGILFKRGDDKTPGIYRLEPGKSMSLSLNTNDGFKCIYDKYIVVEQKAQTMPPLGNGELPGHREFNCRGFYSLSGALYHLHEFPEITYNLFSTMNHEKWKPLDLDQLINWQYGGQFSRWVPNYEVPPHCLKETLVNFPVESVNKQLMECFL